MEGGGEVLAVLTCFKPSDSTSIVTDHDGALLSSLSAPYLAIQTKHFSKAQRCSGLVDVNMQGLATRQEYFGLEVK